MGKGILIDLGIYLLQTNFDWYLLLKHRYLDGFGDLSGSMEKGILIDLGIYLDPWRKVPCSIWGSIWIQGARYLDRSGDLSGSMKKGILIDLGIYPDPWRKVS